MLVLKIDRSTNNPNDYELVQGYKTMVWTERFGPPGEFVMTTDLVDLHLKQLAEDSWITLNDSDEIMQVETRSVMVDDAGKATLTIKGRTLDAFLENRAMVGDKQLGSGGSAAQTPGGDADITETAGGTTWPMLKNYPVSTAIALIIWNMIVDVDPVITGVSGWAEENSIGPYYSGNSRDIIPGVVVTTTIRNPADPEEWWLNLGSLRQNIQDLIDADGGNVGVRTIRPPSSSNRIVSFNSQGDLSYSSGTDMTDIRFDIYDGIDRTAGQVSQTPVVFRYNAGHIENPSYTFSSLGKKNVLKIDSAQIGALFVARKGESENVSGWNRRVGYKAAETPDRKKVNIKYIRRIEQEGRRALGALRRQNTFDGKIGEDATYIYRKHYFLGDKVTVRAQYGFELDMQVTEYIRTQDAEGDRGYPTLVV